MAKQKRDIKKVAKPINKKKKTVIRKITDLQYYTLLWILEHPEEYKDGNIVDTSIFNKESIDTSIKRRCFYVTDDENALIRNYLDGHTKRTTTAIFLKECGWQRNPKFITKPLGSTIRYKDSQTTVAAKEPVLDMPVELTLDSNDVNIYTPTESYPIYSDEERMQLAIKLQRKPADKQLINQCGLSYFDTVDMSQYLFIKDLNRQVQDISDIDYHVLFYMIETSKINSLEAKMVLIKVGAGGIPEKKPHDLIKYGVPRFYDDDSTLLSAMIKAETFAYKYDKMLKEDNPSPEYIFERFKDHIGFEKFPCVKHSQMCEYQYDENVEVKNIDIQDDTVIVTYDDIIEGDEGVKVEVKYNDRELLLNDFFCFEKTFNLDPNKKFNVWGEDVSINDYVKQLYAKYPHGVNGDFYATMKEAYEAGHACINEIA